MGDKIVVLYCAILNLNIIELARPEMVLRYVMIIVDLPNAELVLVEQQRFTMAHHCNSVSFHSCGHTH